MIRLVELILYGIRQFQAMTRVTFSPGFNLLAGNIGTGKSTICELIPALLVPGGAASRPFVHPHHPERAQAALTFEGEGGMRYRLVRDFIKDRVTLSALDPSKPGAPPGGTPLAADPPSVEAALQRLLQGLTAEQLRRHWLLTHAELPSASGYGTNGAPAPAQQASTGRPAAPAGSRLDQLKRALAAAEEVTALDEKAMAAQDRAAAIKQKLTGVSRLTEERASLQAELDGFAGFDRLPPDHAALLEGLAERERALHTHQDGLQEQLNALEEERATLGGEPIFRQWRFQAGAGLTGLAFLLLVIAPFINLTGRLKLIPLIMLLSGLGLAVWSFLSGMKVQQRREQLDAKARSLKIEREAVEKRFGREQRPALELLSLTKCPNVAAFQERLRQYRRLCESIEQLEQEAAQYLGGQAAEQLEEQQRRALDEANKFEEQMRAAAAAAGSSGFADTASLQAEISR
ncbi:MAG: hypothetical protein AB1515_10875, partial [Nitrospirota bacterium]